MTIIVTLLSDNLVAIQVLIVTHELITQQPYRSHKQDMFRLSVRYRLRFEDWKNLVLTKSSQKLEVSLVRTLCLVVFLFAWHWSRMQNRTKHNRMKDFMFDVDYYRIIRWFDHFRRSTAFYTLHLGKKFS